MSGKYTKICKIYLCCCNNQKTQIKDEFQIYYPYAVQDFIKFVFDI